MADKRDPEIEVRCPCSRRFSMTIKGTMKRKTCGNCLTTYVGRYQSGTVTMHFIKKFEFKEQELESRFWTLVSK